MTFEQADFTEPKDIKRMHLILINLRMSID